MKYTLIAALAAVAVALPADDWTKAPEPKPEPPKEPAKWDEAPKPTPKPEWEGVPKKDDKKKVCTTIYVTKECGDKKDAWDNCKDVTKTEVLYDDKCTWAGWDQPPKPTWAPAPEPKKDDKKEWENEPKKDDKKDWEAVPKKDDKKDWENVKVCTYVTVYDKIYTTKECGDKKDAWDNCKDVTKTEKKTETKTDEKCTGTWGDWKPVKETWAPAPEPKKETWAPAPAPEKETWAPAPVPKPAASSTAWSPVAKFTGAADKQTFGFGAVAVAAVAMML